MTSRQAQTYCPRLAARLLAAKRVGEDWVLKRFGDAEELVIFGYAVGAAERAGFDLAGAQTDCQVGDGGVFGFAGAV